ncbi:TetR/AcrR family transcriptional regulator [Streptomyces sp. DT171]|uniref:TetR/AcrR family transcriptional regulator n=1 Tax=Streptomyces sp. DT171 TaxID=3416524 RepID=UPI003CE8C760
MTNEAGRPPEEGPPRGRRQVTRGAARRDQIIAVAFMEFTANGFRGASLAHIAERSGLTQPGLLHHFPSKTALLRAVLEERDRRDSERLGIDLDADVPWHVLLSDLVALVEYNAKAPGLVQMFTVVTGEAVTDEHPARPWAAARYRRLTAHAERALRRGVDDGELRQDLDVRACAQRLFAMMDGLQTQWLIEPESVDMASAFRGYVDEVRRAITA